MKEIKNTKIELRLTQQDKDRIKEYADKHNMTMSEFIRFACEKIFQEENK